MTQFQIYGRTSYEEPLTFIQEITTDPSNLETQALTEVGDQQWIELIAVPSDALIHVTGEDE